MIIAQPKPFGRAALRGLFMMLAQNAAARIVAFVSQLALAAILRPSDFGLIALTYSVTTLSSQVTNIGLDEVLLRRKRAMRFWIGPAFYLSLGLAIVACTIIIFVSPFAAAFYEAPTLIGLLIIIAISIPMSAMLSVPNMLLRAEMRFGFMASYNAVETLAQATAVICLAALGFGAFSFVIPTPLFALVKAAIWWQVAGYRGKMYPRLNLWRYIAKNTFSNFLTRLNINLIGQGDYIVLGLVSDHSTVGSYYFGFRLAAQPLFVLAGNFSNVVFPVLAELRHDPLRQRDAALRASRLLAYSIMPLSFAQAAIAAPLINGVFGSKWAPSIPIIQLLSIGLAIDAISWIAGSLLSARGEFSFALRFSAFSMPIFFVAITIGALLDNAIGVALAVFLFYLATQPVFTCLAYKRIGICVADTLLIYARPILFSTTAVAMAILLGDQVPPLGYQIPRILVILMTSIAAYAAMLRVFDAGVWAEICSRLLRSVARA